MDDQQSRATSVLIAALRELREPRISWSMRPLGRAGRRTTGAAAARSPSVHGANGRDAGASGHETEAVGGCGGLAAVGGVELTEDV
jgi:hypothetical protein